MLTLKCKIEIITGKDNKKIEFDYAHSIEVSTSIDNLTDTATLKLPRSMQRNGKLLLDYINKGDEKDKIKIYMGYEEYGNIEEVFSGYITGKKSEITDKTNLLILSCENEMYNLKTKVKVDGKNYPDFNIKAFFEKFVSKEIATCKVIGNPFFCSMDIAKEMTMAQALNAVRERYPYIKTYFTGNVLYVSTEEELANQEGKKVIVFDPSRNMVSDKLEYNEERKVCIKAVSVGNDCTKIEVFAPEDATEKKNGKTVAKDGYELRTLYCPEYENATDLQTYAGNLANNLTASKMTGCFTTFGVPFVRKGDIVELHDDLQEERNRKQFVVDGVDYIFGTDPKTGGYRQTITLGQQITKEKE